MFIFLLGIVLINSKIQMKIIKTPILSFLPQLKLHHLIVLSNDENVYTIDFTPLNNIQNKKGILDLIIGKNIKGFVRLMIIENTEINDTKKIVSIWEDISKIQSKELSYQIYDSIQNYDMRIIIRNLIYWKKDKNQDMNLYFRNCIHFSNYVKKIVRSYNNIFF